MSSIKNDFESCINKFFYDLKNLNISQSGEMDSVGKYQKIDVATLSTEFSALVTSVFVDQTEN